MVEWRWTAAGRHAMFSRGRDKREVKRIGRKGEKEGHWHFYIIFSQIKFYSNLVIERKELGSYPESLQYFQEALQVLGGIDHGYP